MKNKHIDLNFEVWKEKVDALIYAELKLNYLCKLKQLSEKEKKKIKKILRHMWLNVGDCLPHPNQSLEEAFKLNFRQ